MHTLFTCIDARERLLLAIVVLLRLLGTRLHAFPDLEIATKKTKREIGGRSHIKGAPFTEGILLLLTANRRTSPTVLYMSIVGPLTIPPDQHQPHTALLQRWAQAAWPRMSSHVPSAIPRGSISKTVLMQDASLYSFSAAPTDTAATNDASPPSPATFPPGYHWYHRHVKWLSLCLIALQCIGAVVLIVVNKETAKSGDIGDATGFNNFIASAAILHCAMSLVLVFCDFPEAVVAFADFLTGLGVVIYLMGGIAVSLIYPVAIAAVPSGVFPLSLTAIVALRSAMPKPSVRITASTANISCTATAEFLTTTGTVHPVFGQLVQPYPSQPYPSQPPPYSYATSGYFVSNPSVAAPINYDQHSYTTVQPPSYAPSPLYSTVASAPPAAYAIPIQPSSPNYGAPPPSSAAPQVSSAAAGVQQEPIVTSATSPSTPQPVPKPGSASGRSSTSLAAAAAA